MTYKHDQKQKKQQRECELTVKKLKTNKKDITAAKNCIVHSVFSHFSVICTIEAQFEFECVLLFAM